VRIHFQPVGGVGRRYKLTFPQAQQVVFPHQPLHWFAIDRQAPTAQLRRDPPAAVGWPLQRYALHLVAQFHGCGPSADSAPVKSRSTDSRQRAHPADREWSSGFHFALDLVVNGAPPFAARSRRCCSTCCKARFKKSISSTCCPILRSNSAIRVSSARFWPTPGNARSPNLSTSRLQRYSSWRLTSRLRATKPAGSPARNRCTASSLNSLVNFLRDPIPVSPFAAFWGLTGCLKIGVHSKDEAAERGPVIRVTYILSRTESFKVKCHSPADLPMLSCSPFAPDYHCSYSSAPP